METTEELLARGYRLYQAGDYARAEASLRQVVEAAPGNATAWCGLGIVCRAREKLAEAESSYREALRLNSELPEAYSNLGNVLWVQGDLEAAIDCYQQALRFNPHHAKTHLNLGVALRDQGRLEEAQASFEKAVQIDPTSAEAHYNLANALRQLGNLNGAVAEYQKTLQLQPQFVDAYCNLGNTRFEQGQLDEAVASYKRALQIDQEHAEAHHNLGTTLQAHGRLDEAVASYRRALQIRPDYAEAHGNLGTALVSQARWREAMASYERALQIKHNYAGAHKNLGMLLLLRGEFRQGWQEYEWRWEADMLTPPALRFAAPVWDASSLEGKTILLWAEQGFGDAIQFIRYAKLMKSAENNVVLYVWPQLRRLLSRISSVDTVMSNQQGLPAFDVHAPLLSLPRILDTTLETIPGGTGYIQAEPELVENWQQKLVNQHAFEVGLVWKGSSKHKGDRDRSIPLQSFLALLDIAGCSFVSLQKGHGEEQIGEAGLEDRITHFMDEVEDFADTAAIIENLDLVITVDTSVAHLAGAMGKPTWVLLPFVPDWRWLLDRDDSPWYPTMRLFRQEERGDWDGVIRGVASALRALVTAHPSSQSPAVDSAFPAARTTETKLDLAIEHHREGRRQRAEQMYREILQADPQQPDALHLLGVVLYEDGQYEAAIDSIRHALALKPDSVVFLSNLGAVYEAAGQLEEAVATCQRVLQIDPRHAKAHNHLGMAFRAQGKLDEAMSSYDRALQTQPDYAEAHWNRSLLRLLRGDFDQGWQEYEWRWKSDKFPSRRTKPPGAVWDGSSLKGRTLLLHAEQGLGDTIQFVRFTKLVKEYGGTVVAQVQPELRRLLAGVEGVDQLFARGQQLPKYDVHAAFMGLPGILGTTLETIPAEVPYLAAEPALIEKWKAKLSGLDTLKVGLVWRGRETHKRDKDRSIDLREISPLQEIEQVSLVSLQKGYGEEQIGEAGLEDRITHFMEEVEDFADTAAIIEHLDLVITVDTSVAHLAGALGKPTWVLLPFMPDWRWMLDREDSPWYPTMRLFRQPRRGDWDGMIHMVQSAVRTFVKTKQT